MSPGPRRWTPPPAEEDDRSPLAKARAHARRLWYDFHKALDRKYYLVATQRHDRRLTPEDHHRITGILAEINAYLVELDGQLEIAEARVTRLQQTA